MLRGGHIPLFSVHNSTFSVEQGIKFHGKISSCYTLGVRTIPTGSGHVQEEEKRMEGEEVECLLQTSTFPIGVFMASGRDMEQAKNQAAR